MEKVSWSEMMEALYMMVNGKMITQSNDYQFNNYGSYQFDNGSLRALGAYNGVLTSSDVTELYNWFSDKGYFS